MKSHEVSESYNNSPIFMDHLSDKWASETPLDMNRVKSQNIMLFGTSTIKRNNHRSRKDIFLVLFDLFCSTLT